MHATIGIGESLALIFLTGLLVVYLWGWRRMRRAMPTLATRGRVVAFLLAMIALAAALVWPLPGWSNYLLAMRSLQKVLICMVAAPLLWIALPVHLPVWGIRRWARRGFVRMRRQGRLYKAAQSLTQPVVAWFLFVAAFLFWHDPTLAQFLFGEKETHTVAPWLLLGAALLFWWHVVDTGPRLHRRFPAWLLIVYLISVEIANMVAGISIAFSVEPVYPYYPAVRALLPADALPWSQTSDQIAGGAIVWVFGSFVYIGSTVSILFRLFDKEGSTAPLHLPNWDDHGKFIAPGLEHRVAQNELRKVDLNHR